MDNLQIRQGETLYLTIKSDDLTAETVNLLVKKEGEAAIIDELVSFATIDGERIAVIDTLDTNHDPDTYDYQLTIEYADGTIAKLPDAANCEAGDCDFPTVTICNALDIGVS